MTDRILDFSDQPANLSVRNGLLVIRPVAQRGEAATKPKCHSEERSDEESRRGFSSSHGQSEIPRFARNDTLQKLAKKTRNYDLAMQGSPFNPAALQPLEDARAAPQEQTVPLEDIAVLVAAHPQVSFTLAVIAGLARAGALLVACDDKRQPAAMMLPLITHHLQAERYAAQARLGLPARKRLWQQIVRAKIAAQARVLEERAGKDHGLGAMAERVRSGDPGNAEARAARIYWLALLGDKFRRTQEGDGANPLLNYGYAVLRAIVARAICAAGLHPTFGLHHCNRYDAFCLADDLMEPFRPLVDHTVAGLAAERGDDLALDRDTKRALLEPLLGRYISQEESRTLFDWAARMAFSLAAVVDGSASKLEIPVIWYA